MIYRPIAALPLTEFIALMACLTSLTALSIDAILPALSAIGSELNATNPQQLHYSISLFFLGLAFGQLLFGTLSDSIGRRYVTAIGITIFAAGSILCIYSQSVPVFLAGRIIQGIGIGGPRSSVVAIVRDQYEGAAMARIMSFIMAVLVFVPLLAPLLSQLVLAEFNWQFIFGFITVFALILALWFLCRQAETLRREHRRILSIRGILHSTRHILSSPVVFGYTVALGILFGMFLSYISVSQSIFQTIYNTGDAFPLYFALLSIPIGLAFMANGKLVIKLGMIRLSFFAVTTILIFSLVFLVLCLLNNNTPPLLQFLLVLLPIFFGIGLLLGNLNALAMAPLAERAGIGAALTSSISALISVAVSACVGATIKTTLTPLAIAFIGLASLVAILIVFSWLQSKRNP
ncbi:MAG: MFS transporter [Cellvibrionaceae bacterium]|nr:MFS transporter [Cellvibrionaceae bacterium]